MRFYTRDETLASAGISCRPVSVCLSVRPFAIPEISAENPVFLSMVTLTFDL